MKKPGAGSSLLSPISVTAQTRAGKPWRSHVLQDCSLSCSYRRKSHLRAPLNPRPRVSAGSSTSSSDTADVAALSPPHALESTSGSSSCAGAISGRPGPRTRHICRARRLQPPSSHSSSSSPLLFTNTSADHIDIASQCVEVISTLFRAFGTLRRMTDMVLSGPSAPPTPPSIFTDRHQPFTSIRILSTRHSSSSPSTEVGVCLAFSLDSAP